VHDHPTAEETNVATLEAATPTAPPPTPAEGPGGGGFFARFLRFVEWLGNLLPHPVTLFAIFTVGVLLLSGLAGALGWSVPDPRPEGARGRSANGLIEAVSLLDGNGLRMIVENLVGNFVNFAPLGTVLVAMLGVGVAEKSGLLSAGIRALVLRAPARLLTVAIVFTGVMSNTASEAGYVILVPLAGVIFLAVGRHPIAGMAAAFAGVSGGYSANLLVGTIDPLLAGITQEAAQLLDPGYSVHPAVNYYFMAVSTFLITGLGAWVTDRIVEPQLGRYDASRAEPGIADQLSMEPLSREEKRGLMWAGVSVLAVIPIAVRKSAPLTATMPPRFVQPKKATNCAAKKTMTM
jgi:aminobenzoyl-glutamate transport protein